MTILVKWFVFLEPLSRYEIAGLAMAVTSLFLLIRFA
jgi:multidrug transporter EmrE-like cation transporter